MSGVARRIRDSGAAFRAVVANPALRRLELAWAFAILGHWAYTIAVSVFAYDAGGSTAVGVVFALRLFSAAVIAPFGGLLADHYRRERILLASTLTRIALMGAATICVFADTPAVVVYVLAIGAAIATAPFRPAQAALTPSLARTPGELTAANAVVSTIESFAIFVGPALAGFLLAVTSTGVVFAVNTAMLAIASIFVARIRTPKTEQKPEIEASTIVSEALAGFKVVGRKGPLRVLTLLIAAETVVLGAFEVYIVVIAFQLLDHGASGVGLLNSAMGVGALLGGLVALSLTGARRLSSPFAVGVALVGAPLILLGIWPSLGVAMVLLGIVGVGNTLLDVACFTLVQRAVPDEVLARVFGVLQMILYGALSLGAILAPVLDGAFGIENALIATGVALVVLVGLFWPSLSKIDASAVAPEALELRLLTAIPIFSPLPGTSIEHLAGRLVPLRVGAGTTIVRQGDAGDRFYVVAEGELEVTQDAERLSEIGPGDYFGEIALLRNLPRTATVTAKSDVVLYALDRDEFLAAVTGHPPSAEAAETVVSARLVGVPVAGARLPA